MCRRKAVSGAPPVSRKDVNNAKPHDRPRRVRAPRELRRLGSRTVARQRYREPKTRFSLRLKPPSGKPSRTLAARGKSPVEGAAGSCGRSARSEEDGDPGDLLLAKEKRTTKPATANVRRPKGTKKKYAPLPLGFAESAALCSWSVPARPSAPGRVTPHDFCHGLLGLQLKVALLWPSVVKSRVAPRTARRPADKARPGSILDIFDRGATQFSRDASPLECSGTFATDG